MNARVAGAWRYPVKSMGGESLASARLETRGIPGDRAWAVRDAELGRIRNAKKYPRLLLCTARFVREPSHFGDCPEVTITLPGGGTVSSSDPRAAEALSEVAGVPVRLEPLAPPDDLDAYRAAPPGPDPLAEARQILALEPDDPLPDFSYYARVPGGYTRGMAAPPGTHFDLAPVHLLTTEALAAFRERLGHEAPVDRFRPTLLLETDTGEPFPEFGWEGKRLRLGSAVLRLAFPTLRCAMTTHARPGLPSDPLVMRTLVRETKQNLGAYAWVETPGEFAVGDEAVLFD